MQESLILYSRNATEASRPGGRASAYGLFTGIYGTAWVAGSVVIGVLVSISPGGLPAFCMVGELTVIPLIWVVRARSTGRAGAAAGGGRRPGPG